MFYSALWGVWAPGLPVPGLLGLALESLLVTAKWEEGKAEKREHSLCVHTCVF